MGTSPQGKLEAYFANGPRKGEYITVNKFYPEICSYEPIPFNIRDIWSEGEIVYQPQKIIRYRWYKQLSPTVMAYAT